MPITATFLTSGTRGVSSSASETTASISPTGNRLIVAFVEGTNDIGGSAVIPTLSGNGLTWVEIAHAIAGARGLSAFRAMGASPSSGAVTIDFGGDAQDSCAWIICEFDGVATGGENGSGAVRQPLTVAAPTGTSATVTLGAFADPANGTCGGFYHTAQESVAAGSGFTEIAEITGGSPARVLQVEWRNDNDTTVDASWPTSTSNNLGIAFEIVAAVVESKPPGIIGPALHGLRPFSQVAPTLAAFHHQQLRAWGGPLNPAQAFFVYPRPGPDTYFLTMAGSTAPAGTVALTRSKSLTGTTTPTGTVLRLAQRVSVGSTSPTGALVKLAQRAMAGATTPAGALTPTAYRVRTLTGTVTPVGTILRTTTRLLSGQLSPSGVALRGLMRVLSGGIAPTGRVFRPRLQRLRLSVGIDRPAIAVGVEDVGNVGS